MAKIKHVYGNILRLAIPLTKRVSVLNDGVVEYNDSDFFPSADYPVFVILKKGGSIQFKFKAVVEGNVATIEDDGKTSVGTYQIEVLAYDENGEPVRYMQREAIEIVDATSDASISAGIEFNYQTQTLDGAVLIPNNGVVVPEIKEKREQILAVHRAISIHNAKNWVWYHFSSFDYIKFRLSRKEDRLKILEIWKAQEEGQDTGFFRIEMYVVRNTCGVSTISDVALAFGLEDDAPLDEIADEACMDGTAVVYVSPTVERDGNKYIRYLGNDRDPFKESSYVIKGQINIPPQSPNYEYNSQSGRYVFNAVLDTYPTYHSKSIERILRRFNYHKRLGTDFTCETRTVKKWVKLKGGYPKKTRAVRIRVYKTRDYVVSKRYTEFILLRSKFRGNKIKRIK